MGWIEEVDRGRSDIAGQGFARQNDCQFTDNGLSAIYIVLKVISCAKMCKLAGLRGQMISRSLCAFQITSIVSSNILLNLVMCARQD